MSQKRNEIRKAIYAAMVFNRKGKTWNSTEKEKQEEWDRATSREAEKTTVALAKIRANWLFSSAVKWGTI